MSVSNSKKILQVVELKDVNKIEGKAYHNSKFRKNDKLEKSERLERSVVENNKNFKKSTQINIKKIQRKRYTKKHSRYVSSDSNSSFSSKCDQESILDFKRDLLESGDIVENLNMRGGT
jgi:hypothetical protein